jgi:hypothetical protein
LVTWFTGHLLVTTSNYDRLRYTRRKDHSNYCMYKVFSSLLWPLLGSGFRGGPAPSSRFLNCIRPQLELLTSHSCNFLVTQPVRYGQLAADYQSTSSSWCRASLLEPITRCFNSSVSIPYYLGTVQYIEQTARDVYSYIHKQ